MAGKYSTELMENFKNPRNMREMEDPDVAATVGNSACGDVMTMFLKLDDDTISDAAFQSYGCGPCIALSSIVTEKIKGMKTDDAYALTIRQFTDKYPELPKNKKHCTGLVIVALKKAIDMFHEKKQGGM